VFTEVLKYDPMVTISVHARWDNNKDISKRVVKKSIGSWYDVKGKLSYRDLKRDLDALLLKDHKKAH